MNKPAEQSKGPVSFVPRLNDFAKQRLHELTETDAQFRAALSKPEINEQKIRKEYGLGQVLAKVLEGYAERPALGVRSTERVTDPVTGRSTRRLLEHYETVSYGELLRRAKALGAFWHHDPKRTLRADGLMCIIAFAGVDFATVDIAACLSGIVSVPMQTNGQIDQLLAIVKEVEPRWLCTSVECLDTSVELVLKGHRPAGVLVFDYHPDVDDEREILDRAREKLALAGISDLLVTLSEAVEKGKDLVAPLFEQPNSDDRLSTIYYTSGSTGQPKGAMYPERMNKIYFQFTNPVPIIYLHYAPMNHTFGRLGLFSSLAAGGSCYFTAKSDLSELFEDIQRVRPTSMSFVPRISEMVYQYYKVELERRAPGASNMEALKQELLLKTRNEVLGGRLLGGTTASAALASELRKFMEDCLGYPMVEGFGATEYGGFMVNGRVMRPPIIDYRLDDVPELGYFNTDKPYPRGELWIKHANMMLGYYKRPEVTATVMTQEGYYKTGDILAQVGPDQLTYVDRRNNVTKLAQGEFVAIAQLEALFTNGHPLIKQVYLYGSSSRSYLLGVLVPNEQALKEAGVALDDHAAIKSKLRDAIKAVARKEQLHSYEAPRDFLVEREPFSAENGLLAGIGKYQRPKFKARYGPSLEKLYDDIAGAQVNELAALRRDGRNGPVLETVVRAVRATLGLEDIDVSSRASFADVGGDSLSALACSILLEEIYDIEVSASVINNPGGSLQQIAAFIERGRASGLRRPTFASIHGKGATEIRASELTLEKFIDAKTLAAGLTAVPAVSKPGNVRTVLVTGATGHLGRFLCLEWLERMAKVDGRVICIARGIDAAGARERVAAAFHTGDADLQRHFAELSKAHLEVLAGDLSEPDLGLASSDWQRLAETVDLIVHPAAFVNHVLPYASLFGPNVVGTAELIRLAITHRQKPIINVSTIAAAMLPDGSVLDEAVDVRQATPLRRFDSAQYADGYAHSKWAGEVLLREAHDRYKLPVSVFRSDMILPHSKYTGQVNIPDMLTRWLMSVVLTGLAPKSFYSGDVAHAHYDGLPGDFTAESISTLGVNALSGYRTYHVVNPHEDAISMDTFIDWAIEAGYKIERIAAYEDWVGRFETALRALPEKQRQQSSLPLLHQLKAPMPAIPGAHADASRFRADVKKYGIGPDRDIPHLTAPFILKYLADLQSLGLLQRESHASP